MSVQLTWRKNPDLDRTMKFLDDPFAVFKPEPWDSEYELVWYIDPRFNPLEDKVWAIKAIPIGCEVTGVKDMGYLTPDVNITINNELPDLGLNIDDLCPAYYDLACECVYRLDPEYTPDGEVWVLKFTPAYRKPLPAKVVGTISPELTITYNKQLPKMDYDLDHYAITWQDLAVEHIWMLDNKHKDDSEKEIWVIKAKAVEKPKKRVIVDYISPVLHLTLNGDLGDMDFGEIENTYIIPYHDMKYEHIWYLDNEFSPNWSEIWAAKLCYVTEPEGTKVIGTIRPIQPLLDVVFISYDEPNAEENWQRLLEFVPYAHRVQGVTGIFEAHKAAAKLVDTDMFFVVDGDTYIEDGSIFNGQPGLFDRTYTYIWNSRNPVNDLIYSNGGIKLFPRNLILKQSKWNKLDFAISISEGVIVKEEILSIHSFNTDEFNTWKTAFRECVKLYTTNQMIKLDKWLQSDVEQPFGESAVQGAQDGYEYAKDNRDDMKLLMKINDFNWLKKYYEEKYGGIDRQNKESH